ncbi:MULTISPECIES: DUF2441 domain-containing protein [Bhargavaea]|uniref:DUF2441 domain-containing protein n=1 Tax=Bhargavaea changchunensis TaxID=2134037 RepID=A0ABW2NBS3_9BACL|nr:DUF2441 domain-containing protein [Bhargavaea sp. CC-171006]
MKEVNGEVFYHINSKSNHNPYDLLRIGDKFKVGDKLNPFMKLYEDEAPPLELDRKVLFNAAVFYWHYTREITLEQIRLSINNELPSRFNSLWVTDYDRIQRWRQQFAKSEHQVLELSLTGQIFQCDAGWVEGNPIPLSTLRQKAGYYWSGEIVKPDSLEYLFEGEAEVIRIL